MHETNATEENGPAAFSLTAFLAAQSSRASRTAFASWGPWNAIREAVSEAVREAQEDAALPENGGTDVFLQIPLGDVALLLAEHWMFVALCEDLAITDAGIKTGENKKGGSQSQTSFLCAMTVGVTYAQALRTMRAAESRAEEEVH